jgi:myo-inositol-1(or 4)-monophosphatase
MSDRNLTLGIALFTVGCVASTIHLLSPKRSTSKCCFCSDSIEARRKEFYSEFGIDSSNSFSTQEKDIGNVARLAAYKAGKIMRDGLGSIDQDDIVSKIGSRDIVTQVDKDCQDTIKETILSYFPSHKFLGEEDVDPGREAAQQALENLKNEPHLWIVDPVDGTTNYAHGMPLSVVIIAYVSYGKVKHGFIYDPYRNESFVAWEGKGAFFNGKRFHCPQTNALNQSIMCTGSPPNISCLEACLRVTDLLSSKVRSFRILGSAGLALAWTSIGRVTAFAEPDLNSWDCAAGCLIIKEAGGRVTDVWGKEFELSTRNIVATNGILHEQFLKELQTARAWLE